MVKIGRFLINPARVDAVEDSRNRAAHPGVSIWVHGGKEYWIENITLDEVHKILERHLDTL